MECQEENRMEIRGSKKRNRKEKKKKKKKRNEKRNNKNNNEKMDKYIDGTSSGPEVFFSHVVPLLLVESLVSFVLVLGLLVECS